MSFVRILHTWNTLLLKRILLKRIQLFLIKAKLKSLKGASLVIE